MLHSGLNNMREGPQLGVAKAARAPPCTLPILGRRLPYVKLHRLFQNKNSDFNYKTVYLRQRMFIARKKNAEGPALCFDLTYLLGSGWSQG